MTGLEAGKAKPITKLIINRAKINIFYDLRNISALIAYLNFGSYYKWLLKAAINKEHGLSSHVQFAEHISQHFYKKPHTQNSVAVRMISHLRWSLASGKNH